MYSRQLTIIVDGKFLFICSDSAMWGSAGRQECVGPGGFDWYESEPWSSRVEWCDSTDVIYFGIWNSESGIVFDSRWLRILFESYLFLSRVLDDSDRLCVFIFTIRIDWQTVVFYQLCEVFWRGLLVTVFQLSWEVLRLRLHGREDGYHFCYYSIALSFILI